MADDPVNIPPGQGGYAGQLGISDTTDEYNVLTGIIWQMMAQLRTMIPVKVMAVSPGTGGGPGPPSAGTVDVLPLVNMVDGLGNPQKHETVLGIPYFRLGGANGQIVSDPTVNDIGYIHCADRDISSVVGSGGQQSNPGSNRRFSLRDGVYVGGFLSDAPTQYLVFTADGLTLADKNGNSIVMAAAGITIKDVNGNQIVTGPTTFQAKSLTLGQIGLNTHTHPANGSPPTPGT